MISQNEPYKPLPEAANRSLGVIILYRFVPWLGSDAGDRKAVPCSSQNDAGNRARDP